MRLRYTMCEKFRQQVQCMLSYDYVLQQDKLTATVVVSQTRQLKCRGTGDEGLRARLLRTGKRRWVERQRVISITVDITLSCLVGQRPLFWQCHLYHTSTPSSHYTTCAQQPTAVITRTQMPTFHYEKRDPSSARTKGPKIEAQKDKARFRFSGRGWQANTNG